MSARERKLLFMPSDEELAEFYSLACLCGKICLVAWAHGFSGKYVEIFEERCCDDDRVRKARDAAYLWSKGAMKMPQARQFILAAHKAASECGDSVAEAAARAVAHAAATVHSKRHAAGLALYGLTALAKEYGRDSAEVREEIQRLMEGLRNVALGREYEREQWAAFILKADS